MHTDLEERARALDAIDPLAAAKGRFAIDDDLVYLDGNSLGRPARASLERVHTTLTDGWPRNLVMGWEDWLDIGQRAGAALAPLIGATSAEVAVADQTSVCLLYTSDAADERGCV